MYLAALSKHPHFNSNQLMITIYKIHCLIQSRSMTYASLSRSIMPSLVDPMTKDNLDTNILACDRNLIIMISSRFLSRYVCNTLKYTLVVFNLFRVFCRYNLNFS